MTNRENCVKWIKDYFANNKDGAELEEVVEDNSNHFNFGYGYGCFYA